MRAKVLLAVAILVLGSVVSFPVRADGIGSVPGSYTWSSLGNSSDIVVSNGVTAPSENVWAFEASDDVLHSDELWWYVNMSVRIGVSRAEGREGIANLWMSVNDRSAVLIKVQIEGVDPVEVTTVSFDGESDVLEDSDSVEVEYRNLLQVNSVQPGANTVKVWLETIDDPGNVVATVLSTSSFEVSTDDPFPLRLDQGTLQRSPDSAVIPLRLSSLDGALSQRAQVNVVALDGSVTVTSPLANGIAFDDLAAPRQFEIEAALREGSASGRFVVNARASKPNETLSVVFEMRRTAERRAWEPSPLGVLVLAATTVFGLGLVLRDTLANRRRTRGR